MSKRSAATATKMLQLRPYKATAVGALQPRVPVNTTEGQSLQNELSYRRRVEGNHTKRNFVSSSGKTSSGEFKTT
jgi:hypothetical protein